MHNDGGMSKILVGKLLVQSARVHHHTYIGLVDIGQRLVAVGLGCPAQNGFTISQIAIAHQHGLFAGIGDGDAANGQIECLRIGRNIGRKCRPRGWHKLYVYAQALGNLTSHLDTESPVRAVGLAEG